MPNTAALSHPARIALLRKDMTARGIDAYVVPRFDAHQGEYVAAHDARLAWLTGFTGSAGMALITQEAAAIFVDGRYTVQIVKQCGDPIFQHHHFFDDPIDKWAAQHLTAGQKLALDPMLIPPSWYARFVAAAETAGAEVVALSENLIDPIWADQPAKPMGKITGYPVQYSGRSFADKRDDLRAEMARVGADFCVETQPDNIAWLLNVRGNDVAFNPMPHSFLLIAREGATDWCVDPLKLDPDLTETLPLGVEMHLPDAFLQVMTDRLGQGATVMIDPDFSPVAAQLTAVAAGARVITQRSPLTMTKAHKNPVEMNGLYQCHVEDGVAWVQFSAWLATEVPRRAAAGNPVHEREAEEKIRAFRSAQPGYVYDSFNPISAAAGNASMCHYSTSETSNVPILPQNPYLLDSGGQYETGTTDATRSFSFGTRPEGYDRAYTAVFKAFVALSTLRFPKGTQGHHIDAICRRPLWDLGLDYDHGTGHGIGHYLSVHEQPQRIAKPYNPVDLRPGMVMSIEPGHYMANSYGIRIENIFEVVEEDDGFMVFRNMTLIPIQTDMLILDALSPAERDWLNQYHRSVFDGLSSRLEAQDSAWLSAACQPLR